MMTERGEYENVCEGIALSHKIEVPDKLKIEMSNAMMMTQIHCVNKTTKCSKRK